MRYIMMIIGAAIYTYGLDVFLVPNYLIDGGVVGCLNGEQVIGHIL